MALAFAQTAAAKAPLLACPARDASIVELPHAVRARFDPAFRWSDDGLSIVEVASGRTFDPNRWPIRGE